MSTKDMRSDTRFVSCLPELERVWVTMALIASGIGGADFDRAMCSRVCDLADAIGASA